MPTLVQLLQNRRGATDDTVHRSTGNGKRHTNPPCQLHIKTVNQCPAASQTDPGFADIRREVGWQVLQRAEYEFRYVINRTIECLGDIARRQDDAFRSALPQIASTDMNVYRPAVTPNKRCTSLDLDALRIGFANQQLMPPPDKADDRFVKSISRTSQ